MIEKILATYLGNSDFRYIGSGAYASVYAPNDNEDIVYKVTTDKEDYLTAKRLLKYHKRFNIFVKVFKVDSIQVKYSSLWGEDQVRDYYIIVTERVKPFEETEFASYRDYWEEVKVENGWFCDLKNIKEISKPDPTLFTVEKCDFLIKEAENVVKNLKKLGYNRWDGHAGNFSLDSENKIKIFDFGCANKAKDKKVKPRLNYNFIEN